MTTEMFSIVNLCCYNGSPVLLSGSKLIYFSFINIILALLINAIKLYYVRSIMTVNILQFLRLLCVKDIMGKQKR